MTMIRQIVRAQVNTLGDDEVEIVMSTGTLARDGHILVPQGCILDGYRANPIILWQHDPDHPIGNAEDIQVSANAITARIRFAPLGISQKADEVRGLVKSGVIRAASVGFEPMDGEPLNPQKPRGGQRFTKWELLECSFVSVPSDTAAIVTARAKGDDMADKSDWKVGASRDLPVEDSDAWDGSEAEKSIFDWAGGDEFSPSKARKGFLVYDASKPDDRGSYKLPIAHVVDDELKVPKGAIRAAASRLPQTDIPDDVKERAQAVLDHYKEKADMNEDDKSDRGLKDVQRRFLSRAPSVPLFRGLYDVANLACMVEQLGYAKACSDWEKAIEEDDSVVPEMLGEALVALGEALIAMTKEEVSELLNNVDVNIEIEADDDASTVEERCSPRVRAWRKGIAAAKSRSGKTISAATAKTLQDIADTHDAAMDHHRAAMKLHKRAIAAMRDVVDASADPASDNDDESTDEKETTGSTPTDDAGKRRRELAILELSSTIH